jgi:transcriptional regulator with GAF, ATPase, and Fis domain
MGMALTFDQAGVDRFIEDFNKKRALGIEKVEELKKISAMINPEVLLAGLRYRETPAKQLARLPPLSELIPHRHVVLQQPQPTVPATEEKTSVANPQAAAQQTVAEAAEVRDKEIMEVLARHGGNKTNAAKELGRDRNVVYRAEARALAKNSKKTLKKITAHRPFG